VLLNQCGLYVFDLALIKAGPFAIQSSAVNYPLGVTIGRRRSQNPRCDTLSAELKAAGITISSGALAKYLSRRSSASAKKPAKHVAEPHGQVKTGTKEPEHRESGTGPK
jgi:hypothetical protein